MKGIQGTSNKTYRQLMGNGLRYEIPKFQRDYSWETEQWDDLWQDIRALLSDEDQEHYMGYLVLQTSNNKEFQIIDGQQRITTMSLLVLAVLKSLKFLSDAGVDSESDLYTVEHILPENAEDTWGEFSFEEIKRSVYRLGNLILLEKKLNREAGQLPYTEKIKWFQRSKSELTRAVPEHFDSWNEDKVAARQRELAKHAKAVWKIQELNY